MRASVIICTRGRHRLLRRTLEALAAQSVPAAEFEVVIVNDGADPETAEECRAAERVLPNLVFVPLAVNVGLGPAGNEGVRRASGELLLFTDDDCVPRPDWVAAMTAALETHPIVAGAVDSPRTDYMVWCNHIAYFHPFMPDRPARTVEFIAGANMGIRRACFTGLGGFEAGRTMGPDMELVLRARTRGYAVWFEPKAVVLHDPPADRGTLAASFEYAEAHSEKTVQLRNRYRSLLKTPRFMASWPLVLLASPLMALKVTLQIYRDGRVARKSIHTLPVVYLLKLAWGIGAARGLRSSSQGLRSRPISDCSSRMSSR